ncbi:MAG TPA: F0F1 ATP synthase subunit B [Pseudomonadales bacterium]|jgi:F-type H+-transporting ATPase subunit b
MNLNLTLIGQSITFLVFVWFCWKYIWPYLIRAMQERQRVIGEGLAAAERAEKDLALAQERAAERLREAKEEAQRILEQARHQANQMIENAKNEARAEGERLKEAQRAELELEVNRVKESLRSQVAALAIAGAEKVLGASIDAARHRELIDRLAAEL